MTDLNDNAKEAVREFADYIGQRDKCERYLEAFVTKKTVADAYESHKTWHSIPDDTEALYCEPVVLWHIKGNHFHKGNTNFNDKVFYKVCTRAEFEAYVKEQEGEKWTHLVETTGKKCQLLRKEQDSEGCYAVLLSCGMYDVEHGDFIKPINPKRFTFKDGFIYDGDIRMSSSDIVNVMNFMVDELNR